MERYNYKLSRCGADAPQIRRMEPVWALANQKLFFCFWVWWKLHTSHVQTPDPSGLEFVRRRRNMWSLNPKICRENTTFSRKNCGYGFLMFPICLFSLFTDPLKTSACQLSPVPHEIPQDHEEPRRGSAWSANQRRPNRWRNGTSCWPSSVILRPPSKSPALIAMFANRYGIHLKYR